MLVSVVLSRESGEQASNEVEASTCRQDRVEPERSQRERRSSRLRTVELRQESLEERIKRES